MKTLKRKRYRSMHHCIKGVITHPRQKRAITPYRSEACLPLNKELCVMLRGLSLLPLLDE